MRDDGRKDLSVHTIETSSNANRILTETQQSWTWKWFLSQCILWGIFYFNQANVVGSHWWSWLFGVAVGLSVASTLLYLTAALVGRNLHDYYFCGLSFLFYAVASALMIIVLFLETFVEVDTL